MTRQRSLLLGTSFLALAALAACSNHEPRTFGPDEFATEEADEVSETTRTNTAGPVAQEQQSAGEKALPGKKDISYDPAPPPPADLYDSKNEERAGAIAEGEPMPTSTPVAMPMGGARAEDSDMDMSVATRPSPDRQKSAERKPMAPRKESAGGDAIAFGLAGGRASGSGTVAAADMPKTATGSSAVAPPTEIVTSTEITMYGGSEQYTDHGVNPYTLVEDDAQSTFSIDVDTASFTVARKKLEAGVLPPQEAIRVEEFVNWLDYDYAAPAADSSVPFAVHMDAMPDPFRPGRHIMRVGVQGKEVSRDERPPLHLTFLVDVSGSMSSPDKLPLAKQSLHMLVDSLREDDTIALATYAGRTAKILDPTSAADKGRIHAAIEALNSGGGTAMSSGLDLAYGMAWDSFEAGHENRVIVLSDGDANIGRTSFDEMLSQIKGYADRGVTMTTIGLGMGNYKDTLMEQLSNKGDGNNFYIDSQDAAQRIFVDELGGTLVTIARDVKIQVEFNDDAVHAYRLIGYENRDIADADFRNDKVDAGEVGAGHDVTALYEVILKDGYTRDLATVRLRWEQPGADVDQGGQAATERSFKFRDRALAERSDMAARDLRMAYTSATFAEILRNSPGAQELSLDALIAFGKTSARRGEDDDQELIGLMQTARDLGAGTASATLSRR
ncbi:MAG: von Willebrand factor type A domain-containing protein [Alphaproteobacteria bacterium]|nr:von Willebrand factor type A domain-containing protein [Alphaproteobacteria bacterium]